MDKEPDILAGFPRKINSITYPDKDWFYEIQNILKHNFQAEPKGPRFEIQRNTLIWLNKKIQSMP